ncbi:MAG TPA: DUF2141 domain-containing protein [Allosphingosinicella sp.]|nr:DUF2141 domain-containing protein [Allosphingosinicella sp.]
MRSQRGLVRVCVTRSPAHFPDCTQDPEARKLSAPAKGLAVLAFDGLPAGDWAAAAVHDENGNGRLDTFAAIPREGFGFSRNPPLRLGPPRFGEASFAVGQGAVSQSLRMRYLL